MTEQKNKLAEYQEKKDKILRMLEEIQIQIGDNELKDAIVQKQTKLKMIDLLYRYLDILAMVKVHFKCIDGFWGGDIN